MHYIPKLFIENNALPPPLNSLKITEPVTFTTTVIYLNTSHAMKYHQLVKIS
jgi:hypothetical protein